MSEVQRSTRSADLIPVVQKSYDLCAGIYEHVNRFPRAQRGLLGRVVIDDALRLLALLTVANRLRLSSVDCTMRTGRRNPGSEPTGSRTSPTTPTISLTGSSRYSGRRLRPMSSRCPIGSLAGQIPFQW